MRTLENILIECLKSYNIDAHQKKGLTGVWVGDAKIGAQGVKISRWVTMHGLAFNISVDINRFSGIVPCGISDKSVTSLNLELKKPPLFEEVSLLFQKLRIGVGPVSNARTWTSVVVSNESETHD